MDNEQLKMSLCGLVFLVIVAVVAARAPLDPSPVGYHLRVGIPHAAAIRDAEEKVVAGRIFNGAPAALGQFPYFGGLVIHVANSPNPSACGSALISSTRLLTAAHCWDDLFSQARMYTVVLGSQYLFFGGTRIDTSDVEMHPAWTSNPADLNADIAIIRIPGVTFSSTIQPVALAAGPPDFAGQTAQAIGIGITGFGHTMTTNQFLAHIEVPVLSNAQCAQTWGPFVTEGVICTGAGADNANVCSSDSGGPVTVGNLLVGIVSYGNGGPRLCESGYPSGHSRISFYRDWIASRM